MVNKPFKPIAGTFVIEVSDAGTTSSIPKNLIWESEISSYFHQTTLNRLGGDLSKGESDASCLQRTDSSPDGRSIAHVLDRVTRQSVVHVYFFNNIMGDKLLLNFCAMSPVILIR